jgi:hypothetical protein
MNGEPASPSASIIRYAVPGHWPPPGAATANFYISQTMFDPNRFAIFAKPANGFEFWFAGSFDSIEEAHEVAGTMLHVKDTDGSTRPLALPFVDRKPRAPDEWYGKFDRDGLLDVLKEHFKSYETPSTVKALKEALLKPRSLFGLMILAALASFIFGLSIEVPKEVEIPLLGDVLSGHKLGPAEIARWLPAALLILYGMVQLGVAGRGGKLNEVRRAMLELVRAHGFDRDQLMTVMEKKFLQKQSRVVMLFLERQMEGQLGRWLGARPWRETAGNEPVPASEQAAIVRGWVQYLRSDFERRLHHLAMLDRQPSFRAFMTCFDPFWYLASLNRLRWAQHAWALNRGVDPLDLGLPTDPDAIDIRGFSGLVIPLLYIVGLGLPLGWSIHRLEHTSAAIVAQNIAMSAAVAVLISLWCYLAVARRWGYPVGESLGAYTVDVINRQVLTF